MCQHSKIIHLKGYFCFHANNFHNFHVAVADIILVRATYKYIQLLLQAFFSEF